MRVFALVLVASAALLATSVSAQQNSALPDVPGKLGPALEAVHSCTSQAERGNMADDSKRAFVIECVNGNVGSGPPRRSLPAEQANADCDTAASYLEVSGGERESFIAACRKRYTSAAQQ